MDQLHDGLFRPARRKALLCHVAQLDVAVVRERIVGVGHAQLLPLIDIGRALEAEKQRCQHLGRGFTIFLVVSPAGDNARKVVILPEQTVPAAAAQTALPRADDLLQLRQIQGTAIPLVAAGDLVLNDVLKLEHHGKLTAVGVAPALRALDVRAPRLAHRHKILALQGGGAQLLDIFVQHRAFLDDPGLGNFGDGLDCVEAVAARALLRPPVNHVVERTAHLGIFPVQVGLLDGKLMQIILPTLRHPLPRRAAEGGDHIGRRRAGDAVAPDVPVVLRVVPALSGLEEPRMLVRGVVEHHVQHNFDAAPLCLRKQLAHVLQRSEQRVDVAVIRHVIAVVVLRGAENGRKPDHVNAQRLQIIQAGDDARNIADTVAVGIAKAAWINLVNHGFFPPMCRFRHKNILQSQPSCG